MPKKPAIPHEEIVEFILSGKTTLDAKGHFGFASDNVANTRIWAAFKRLGLQRPRFQEIRMCEFCGKKYVAKRRNRQTCGSKECQAAFILRWQSRNPEKIKAAHRRYAGSPKRRAANIRRHSKKRHLGKIGTAEQRWAFALDEVTKSFRKLRFLAHRNPWTYRLEHIQKLSKTPREFRPRPRRNFAKGLEKSRSHQAGHYWLVALRSVQTVCFQRASSANRSEWERTANRLYAAVNTGNRTRRWKRKASR